LACVDEFVKLASMIGGVFLAAGALIAYYDKGTREQKKPFREAQLSLCRDASEAAAILASLTPRREGGGAPSEDTWEKARARFEQLYWGSLAVVEDKGLEARMVDFREQLIKYEKELRAGTLGEDKRLDLQQLALRIAHASRALIAKGWRLVLPEPKGKTEASEKRQQEYAKLKGARTP
jgi:hypothetical protein